MPLDILEPMIDLKGERVLPTAEDFFWRMAARGRLVTLYCNGSFVGVCTFFVLQSPQEVPWYYHRKDWSVRSDVQDGPVIYIDRIATRIWNRSLRMQLEQAITKRIPSWHVAVWYRPTATTDRRVTYYRRG